MANEREDHGVYVYTAQTEDALAVDDLGKKPRRGKARGRTDEAEAMRGGATVPAPTPVFAEDDDLAPAVPVDVARSSSAPTAQSGRIDPVRDAHADPASFDLQPTNPPSSALTDPLLTEVERMVARGDWLGIERRLFESDSSVASLPPRLRLLWAVAAKEAGAHREGLNPDAIAIGATAELLGLDGASQLAMVVGKRLLRRRALASRPAPRPWVSWIIVLVAIAIGAAVGLLIS